MLGRVFDFTMLSIFFFFFFFLNHLLTGKNLQKQPKYFAPLNKNLTLGVSIMQKFINIAFTVPKTLKVVKPPIFSVKFDSKQV